MSLQVALVTVSQGALRLAATLAVTLETIRAIDAFSCNVALVAVLHLTCWNQRAILHYGHVIMSAMASQITGTISSGADQRKHQISASLTFVRGIHRWPANSPHKGPVTRKMFPFGDVIMWYSKLRDISTAIINYVTSPPTGLLPNKSKITSLAHKESYRWVSARKTQFLCISNGAMPFLH